MVMRNRHEGSDSSHWWDDLPPRLRNRFTQQQNAEENERSDRNSTPLAPPPLSRSDVMFDLSRFAILFLLLVIVILLYLLLALSYIHDWQPAK